MGLHSGLRWSVMALVVQAKCLESWASIMTLAFHVGYRHVRDQRLVSNTSIIAWNMPCGCQKPRVGLPRSSLQQTRPGKARRITWCCLSKHPIREFKKKNRRKQANNSAQSQGPIIHHPEVAFIGEGYFRRLKPTVPVHRRQFDHRTRS